MKFFFSLFLFLWVPLFMCAQDSGVTTKDVLRYYKIASPEEKQSIDSLFIDMEARSKAIQIKSICGVDFGMSRESALSTLRNKYGSPMYNPNEMVVSFENVKYGGLDFESVHFLFQSDGIRSYLYSCIFVKGAKNKSEAEEITELYRSVLSRKYELSESITDIGFKTYGGGISPLWDGKWHTLLDSLDEGKYLTAVHTDVIEYDSSLVRDFGNKYGVRIIYGPYEFVEEEF